MYIKITNDTPAAYSVAQLRADNPQVSFPQNIPDTTLAEYGVYPLQSADQPAYDPLTQDLSDGAPVQQGGQWVQTWVVTQASPEAIAQRQAEHTAQLQAQRAEAYRTESDPLFFKAQRGEATQQEWLDKVAEIKTRYTI
jgi:hypothetical protein